MSREGLGREQAAADPAERNQAGPDTLRQRESSGRTAPDGLEGLRTAADLWGNAERSARYHGARAGFFEGVHNWTMFLTTIAAAGSASTLIGLFGIPDVLVGVALFGITCLTAADLALSINAKSHLHLSLRNTFIDLATDIDQAETDEAAIKEWRRALLQAYRKEPPATYHALNALCHNAVAVSIGAPQKSFIKIGFWHRAFRHLLTFNQETFQQTDDKARV